MVRGDAPAFPRREELAMGIYNRRFVLLLGFISALAIEAASAQGAPPMHGNRMAPHFAMPMPPHLIMPMAPSSALGPMASTPHMGTPTPSPSPLLQSPIPSQGQIQLARLAEERLLMSSLAQQQLQLANLAAI